jgi:predicted dehydrogenase
MKVASISFWHLHAKDYIQEAANHPGVDVVALWDEDRRRGIAAAREHRVEFVEHLDGILSDASIEGVIVCSPTADHRDIVTRCIRAGKHVFMEKVLAATLQDATAIVDAAREAGVALVVSLWRSDRGYARQIARMVADGAVGVVTSARIRDGHPLALPADGHPEGLLPTQFYRQAESQGGVLIDLCHPIYLLISIAGPPQRVTSAFGQVTGRPVEDNAAVLFSYANGAIGVAETSFVTRITPFVIEIHGTEGSILYSEPGIGALVAARAGGFPDSGNGPDDRPRLRIRSTREPRAGWQELQVEADAPRAFAQWVEHARTGSRAGPNLDLALALTAAMEAAYTSAANDRTVTVQACD